MATGDPMLRAPQAVGPAWLTRRDLLGSAVGLGAVALARPLAAQPAADVTFVFISDVHACRMNSGLSPNCEQEGKTDQNLLRHIRALNALPDGVWPATIGGRATGLVSAGRRIGVPRGIVVGGDMTDDGGGQTILPSEGTQLLQYSQRYSQGVGEDRVHFPVYAGLGNHDLDQDGPKDHVDWYRRELRDYVEVNHRAGVFFKPPFPADSYDTGSDSYAWSWDGLRMVQLHRFGGDTREDAASGLAWLAADLKANAGGTRPVILFQHYGWDAFSTERWNPQASTFDDAASGAPHWWSEAERQALLDTVKDYNIVAIFHGHQHETPMIYRAAGLDLVKPVASFMGGFAIARVGEGRLDVALGTATDDAGGFAFTHAFSKPVAG